MTNGLGSIGLVLLLLFAGSRADSAAAEGTSNADCLECHDDEEFKSADERSLHVPTAAFAASVHGELECTNCHADVEEIPHEEHLAKVDLDTCEGCHDEAVAAYRTSRHAAAGDRPAAAGCADCHSDVHVARSHTDPASAAHWTHLAATCAKCHAANATTGARLPITRPVEAYLKSVHSSRVAAGTHAAVCSDCHGSHAILPASDPSSTIWPSRVPETCGTCHAAVAAEFRDSVHGAALARGLRDAPSCTNCHGEHDILPSSDPTAPVFTRNIATLTCGRCHGDLRLTRKYGLSAQQVASYQDSFHGLALRAGQVNVANCASCHGVHNILPSSDPRSLISAANLPSTCGKCHPGAGSSFPIGAVHVLGAGSPQRAEFWIRYVYLWVIGLVIGAMVVHTATDFAVKLRHWPPPAAPAPPAPRVRMSRPLRWQHGLVMLSFPVLILTGFALTYPESWWAAPLLRWEARFGLRGTVHRGAALIILGALLWHLGQWYSSQALRARLRGLRWSRTDLRYLGARWAWYLGLRPTLPPSGSFSYIEKAEYWAFLWGMLIMTASGLVLWFSDLTLRHLPKWFTDVATAVHFYEAVLASLAVAVWHLYWVVFDPDVYPMDRSWWSGQPPDSRVREREGEAADDAAPPDTDGPTI